MLKEDKTEEIIKAMMFNNLHQIIALFFKKNTRRRTRG